MKSLVVYESFFGNTKKIAESIANALGAKIVLASKFKMTDLAGIDLLVVGSPTRQFRPSPDTITFLKNFEDKSLNGMRVTAFDTGIEPKDIKKQAQRIILGGFVSVFGYASTKIAKQLVVKGGKLIAEPAGFFVLDSEGPLREGELERAQLFAKKLLRSKK